VSEIYRSHLEEIFAEPNECQLTSSGRSWFTLVVASFFSGLKRTMGSTLTSRKPSQLLAEAAFKVLAYLLRR